MSFLPHETWLQVSHGPPKNRHTTTLPIQLKKIPHVPKWHFNHQISFARLTYFINIHFLCSSEWRFLDRVCVMVLLKVKLLDKMWIISSILFNVVCNFTLSSLPTSSCTSKENHATKCVFTGFSLILWSQKLLALCTATASVLASTVYHSRCNWMQL